MKLILLLLASAISFGQSIMFPGPGRKATAAGGGVPGAFVQSTSSITGSDTSVALAYLSNNTNGNLLVAGLEIAIDGSFPVCSDSAGNTWAVAHTQSNAAVGLTDIIAYAVVTAATGANTVTCNTFGGTSGTTRFAIAEYSGYATTSPLDQATGQNGNSTNPTSGNVTTTAANELIVGVTWGPLGSTAGTNFTVREDVSSGVFVLQDWIQTSSSAGSYAATWVNATSGNWTAQVATFKVP